MISGKKDCRDKMPRNYDFECIEWGCQQWAENNWCGFQWNFTWTVFKNPEDKSEKKTMCAPGVTEYVKDTCRYSCENCDFNT